MRAAERYNLLRCAMSFIWLVTALITEQNAVSRSTCQYHYAGRAPRGSARLTIGIFKRRSLSRSQVKATGVTISTSSRELTCPRVLAF